MRAAPEPFWVDSTGPNAGGGNVRVPLTRRAVMEWINWIAAALISIRVPGSN